MEISLHSAVRKAGFLLVAFLLAATYTVFTARQYWAAHLGARADLPSLQRAVALEPGNSDYRYLLGRYYWLVDRDPDAAVAAYRSAVSLNPHPARYWLDLAAVYQFLGDIKGQIDALERAVFADPTT